MVTTNPIVPPPSDPIVPPPLMPPLGDQIDLWQSHGVSTELIVLLIMTNDQGTGAMDNVSKKVKKTTDETADLNKVQSDLIDIYNDLSKIEKNLGTGKDWPDPAKRPLTDQEKKDLDNLKAAYKKLFGDKDDGTSGDLFDLEKLYGSDSDAGGLIEQTKAFHGDLNTDYAYKSPDDKDKTDTSFNFGKGIMDADPAKFITAVYYAATLFWKANNSTPNSPSPLTSDNGAAGPAPSTDPNPIGTWTSDADTCKSLTTNLSQQKTTEIQANMQLLQGYDGCAQQLIQLAAQQKTQEVQNQKTS
jgi:hypothetical protein